MRKLEYVWLDGYKPEQSLRSKVRVDDYVDMWSFDGSSTQQATGNKSDCLLKPVAEYRTIDRIRADATRTAPGLEGTYVMCEVLIYRQILYFPELTHTEIIHQLVHV